MNPHPPQHAPAVGAPAVTAAATPKCPFARLFGGTKPAAPSLADELRERTREAHTRAEKHPVQARMV
ncbi:MAG TPA: hypothetical protein VG797_12000, partial [Phycisphaerales bacterium]|nr:hypothetical protein [Phycisphaerales bacterium]